MKLTKKPWLWEEVYLNGLITALLYMIGAILDEIQFHPEGLTSPPVETVLLVGSHAHDYVFGWLFLYLGFALAVVRWVLRESDAQLNEQLDNIGCRSPSGPS